MEQLYRINLPVVDSTNSFIRDMLDSRCDMPGMTLVVADSQTAGRGQQGNSWESETGVNLLFSILCHPDFTLPSEQFILSQCMALAVCGAIREALVAEGVTEAVSVKWPNDVYVGDRKVSGTLIECDLQGRVIANCIIGTGINVNQHEFHSDAPNPVSMCQLCGHELDRESILDDVIRRFRLYYEDVRSGESDKVRAEYMRSLYWREGRHHFEDVRGEFTAEIAGIEPTGHLVLRFDNGATVRYEFKEVRFLIDRH